MRGVGAYRGGSGSGKGGRCWQCSHDSSDGFGTVSTCRKSLETLSLLPDELPAKRVRKNPFMGPVGRGVNWSRWPCVRPAWWCSHQSGAERPLPSNS